MSKIVGAAEASVLGHKIDAFDVRPEQFPDGVDLVLMQPGHLEPLFANRAPAGSMLLFVKPELAAQLRRSGAVASSTQGPAS